jgi:hypothetical protein
MKSNNNYNDFTLLSYSQLYNKIDKLTAYKLDLLLKIVNLDDLEDEDEIDDINLILDKLNSSLEVFLYELRIREEFIFNIFGTEENQFEMCLN